MQDLWKWLDADASPKYRFVSYTYRFAWGMTLALVYVVFGETSRFGGGVALYASMIVWAVIAGCNSALLNNSTRLADRVERLEQELKTLRGEQSPAS